MMEAEMLHAPPTADGGPAMSSAMEISEERLTESSQTWQPAPTDTKKLSWKDLQNAVRETRRGQMNIANKIPNSFVFRRSGDRDRLYFLCAWQGSSREHTLLYVDLPKTPPAAQADVLLWNTLLDTSVLVNGFSSNEFSKEEQLLRERKRLSSFGITQFDHNLNYGLFLFAANSSLFYCDDTQFTEEPLEMREVKSTSAGVRMDAKLCHSDENLSAFVRNNDLWVANHFTGQEKQLTSVRKKDDGSETACSAGVPSFVVQEEFDRFTGYWWHPHSTSEENGEEVHRILYEEVDESQVEVIYVPSMTSNAAGAAGRAMDGYRYPRAGTANATCTLHIAEFRTSGATPQIAEELTTLSLTESLKDVFPWFEYLVRCGWMNDGKFVWMQLLSRHQERLVLVLVPVRCFIAENASDDMKEESKFYGKLSLSNNLQVIYEETSDIWVNVHNVLHFLPQTCAGEVKFVWASEESGHCHLYLVTSNISDTADAMEMDAVVVRGNHEARVKDKIRLTGGDEERAGAEWEVIAKKLWIDESKGRIFLMAFKDTPLEPHLYAASASGDGTAQPKRLTEPGYSHVVTMSSDCDMFVTVFSSVKTLPKCHVFRVNDDLSTTFVASLLDTQSFEPMAPPLLTGATTATTAAAPANMPDLFSFPCPGNSELKLHGMVYKPANKQPNKLYPTVLFVYGGPQVRLVNNAYKGTKYLRLDILAAMGYAVVAIDGRGSFHRGLQFEGHIKNNMGTVELEDQIAGLRWLANECGFIDINRVAIHGWSYGGYLSLMGIATAPSFFKIAIAGAPVTMWEEYDTGYTERYLGLPIENPDVYNTSSIISRVSAFPDEENRLLIVHGLIDENVHFHHTSLLINALVKACKPYRLQVYPNERHGIRQPDASEHYETLVLSFLQQHL